jgi:hypothetical protein
MFETHYKSKKRSINIKSHEDSDRLQAKIDFLKIRSQIVGGEEIDPDECSTKYLLSMIAVARDFQSDTEYFDELRENKPIEWE